MDEIAVRAGVSKQTVSLHLGSKESLFLVVTTAATDAITEELAAQLTASRSGSQDFTAELHAFARTLADSCFAPRPWPCAALSRRRWSASRSRVALGLRTVRAGTSSSSLRRFRNSAVVAADLAIEDLQLHAEQFNWLVLASAQNHMIIRVVEPFTELETDRMAAADVRLFLGDYQARPDGPGH